MHHVLPVPDQQDGGAGRAGPDDEGRTSVSQPHGGEDEPDHTSLPRQPSQGDERGPAAQVDGLHRLPLR